MVNKKNVNSRPYMTPIWMAFTGELQEYYAVTKIRRVSRRGVSGVAGKASRYLGGLEDATVVAVCGNSLSLCTRRISYVFFANGGRDNTRAERLISMLTYSGLTLHLEFDVPTYAYVFNLPTFHSLPPTDVTLRVGFRNHSYSTS